MVLLSDYRKLGRLRDLLLLILITQVMIRTHLSQFR